MARIVIRTDTWLLKRPPKGISDMPEEEGNPLSHFFCCFLGSVFQKQLACGQDILRGLGRLSSSSSPWPVPVPASCCLLQGPRALSPAGSRFCVCSLGLLPWLLPQALGSPVERSLASHAFGNLGQEEGCHDELKAFITGFSTHGVKE